MPNADRYFALRGCSESWKSKTVTTKKKKTRISKRRQNLKIIKNRPPKRPRNSETEKSPVSEFENTRLFYDQICRNIKFLHRREKIQKTSESLRFCQEAILSSLIWHLYIHTNPHINFRVFSRTTLDQSSECFPKLIPHI